MPTMIPPFRHRVSLWLGLFVTVFLLWASWHSQYHCPRFNLPLGKGRAITGLREDRQTLLIYGHQHLSQLLSFTIQPKRKALSLYPPFASTTLQSLLISAEQSRFRTLLIRDSHILTAWFILWLGGLAWQHRRLKRLAPPPP